MQKLYKEENVQEIAEAIRNKNGKDDIYKISEMPQAIQQLPSVADYEKALENQKPKTVTGNPIYLEDSADEQLEKLDILGNTEQEGEPTPEYPQEIKCVGADVNLFDKNNIQIVNGILLDSGIFGDNPLYFSFIMKCKENTEYTILKAKGQTFRVADFTNEPKFGDNYNSRIKKDLDSIITFTTASTSNYLVINFMSTLDTMSIEEMLDSIKISKGTSTTYSTYGQGSIELKVQNKNLVEVMNLGYYNNEGVWDYEPNFCSSNKIEVKEGRTYVGTFFDKSFNKINKTVYVVFDADNQFSRFSAEDSITILEGEKYVSIRSYSAQQPYVNSDNFLLQFEEGENATEYKPRQEKNFIIPTQKEFCKIDNVADRFVKVVDKWYEYHAIDKIVLNGFDSENWFYSPITDASLFRVDFPKDSIKNALPFSSHFKSVQNRFIRTLNSFYCNYELALKTFDFIIDDSFSSLSIWKNWLQQNPVTVYYILAIPELIECTPEQSKILEQIENTLIYKGGTYIIATSKEANPILEAQYYIDIDTLR